MAVTSQLTEEGKTLIISVSGRFDITSFKEFGDAYKDSVGSVSRCVVDMEEVEHLDSSALGQLLMLRERAGGENAEIEIVKSKPAVKNILTMAKFERLFKIE